MTTELTWEDLLIKAKAAAAEGATRGRFIRENSDESTPELYLQLLSDAYSAAVRP